MKSIAPWYKYIYFLTDVMYCLHLEISFRSKEQVSFILEKIYILKGSIFVRFGVS